MKRQAFLYSPAKFAVFGGAAGEASTSHRALFVSCRRESDMRYRHYVSRHRAHFRGPVAVANDLNRF